MFWSVAPFSAIIDKSFIGYFCILLITTLTTAGLGLRRREIIFSDGATATGAVLVFHLGLGIELWRVPWRSVGVKGAVKSSSGLSPSISGCGSGVILAYMMD